MNIFEIMVLIAGIGVSLAGCFAAIRGFRSLRATR